MPGHSSPLAEERLYPSAEAHQSATSIAARTQGQGGRQKREALGRGPGGIELVGAFEVSKGYRILQVGSAVAYCLLASGVVFGYAALKPVMIKEGVYRERCTQDEIGRGLRVCYEQEIRLNFMFTVAAVATNVCALLVGTILDHYGPRISSTIGSILFALGCLGFSFAKRIHGFDPYLISYLLLALGGSFIFIPSFHLSNAFPAHSGLVLSILTGAFDSSSAVFLAYRVAYEKTNGKISLSQWFFGYLIVPAFILTAQLTIMPSKSYKTIGELVRQAEVEAELLLDEDSEYEIDDDEIRVRREHRKSVVNEIDHLLGGKDARAEHDKKVQENHESSGVWGAMHGKSISKQVCSWWFILITLFTVIQMTRINYFVATVRPQYEFLLHSYHLSVQINKLFDLALPLGGLLSIPLIGYILDRTSTLTTLHILVILAAVIGGLGIVENSIPAAIAGILLFVCYRPFYYTAVSDYAAKVFGFKTFGKIYGLIICIAGLVNLSQTALDDLRMRLFRKDPRPINSALILVSLAVGVPLVLFVWSSGWKIKRRRLGLEAESAEETLMPGGSLNGYGGV